MHIIGVSLTLYHEVVQARVEEPEWDESLGKRRRDHTDVNGDR